MFNSKVQYVSERVAYVCFIAGVLGGILRHFYYISFLGSGLDLIWTLAFSLVIYNTTLKYIWMLIPLLLGISFELIQLFFKLYFPNFGGSYYPGTPDINDVIAYLIGYLIAICLILFLNKIYTVNK